MGPNRRAQERERAAAEAAARGRRAEAERKTIVTTITTIALALSATVALPWAGVARTDTRRAARIVCRCRVRKMQYRNR